MSKNHYDTWQFNQAQGLKEISPEESIEKFEEYLKQYKNDYSAYGYYASNLINVGRIKDAEKVIDWLEKAAKADQNFVTNQPQKMKSVVFSILYNRLRIYSYQKKYKQLYELLNRYQKELEHLHLTDLMFI